MGFSHLLDTEAALANFRAVFAIHNDVEVAYCHKGDIAFMTSPSSVFSIDVYLRGQCQVSHGPFYYLELLGFMAYVLTNFHSTFIV